MNLGQILTKIETGIQDDSFTREDDLLPLVNEFVRDVNQQFRLPELQVQETITIPSDIDGNQIAMPETYGRELYRVYNDTHMRLCMIRSNVKALEKIYDGWRSKGFVRDVTVTHNILNFRPLPVQDQELTLFFYRDPVEIEDVDEDEELDGIPEHLTKYAVDYALWQLFTLVEDGIDGKAVNTDKYFARYQLGLAAFNEFCKNSPKQVPVIPRTARFF
jgi:hypothetical protein